MKAQTITSLVIGITLSTLAPTAWAAGRGGGGGGGGFHGGGGGGGGFHGGGSGGGAHFAAPGRSFGGAPSFAPQRRGVSAFPASGFRASGVSGMYRTGTNIPHLARIAPQQRGIAATARPVTPLAMPRLASNPNANAFAARQQAGARQNGLGVRQNGLNGRTDHIAEQHGANWNRDWDHRHSHFRNGRFFVFDNGFWWGLDEGYYPWDYYPYYSYDYYPYDYYVGSADDAPASYEGSMDGAPQPDATVANVQTQLTQQGYYGGPIDGLFGATTRDALARYQTSKNLNVTGSLSPDTLQSFGLPAQASTN